MVSKRSYTHAGKLADTVPKYLLEVRLWPPVEGLAEFRDGRHAERLERTHRHFVRHAW